MKKNNQQKNIGPASSITRQGGFTLIELMVATSIFVIVMLASMSSLFVLLDAGKNSRSLRFAMDNVNFAMESMTRSIRMGTNYYCVPAESSVDLNNLDISNDCSSSDTGTLIAFKPQAPTATSKVAYKILDGAVLRCGEGNPCIPITSPDVTVDRLRFIVNGSSLSDNTQASVYIIMKGTITTKEGTSSFSVQTMASQRNF